MLRATCSLLFDCVYSSKPTEQSLPNCTLSEYCAYILPQYSSKCVDVFFVTSQKYADYEQKLSAGVRCGIKNAKKVAWIEAIVSGELHAPHRKEQSRHCCHGYSQLQCPSVGCEWTQRTREGVQQRA